MKVNIPGYDLICQGVQRIYEDNQDHGGLDAKHVNLRTLVGQIAYGYKDIRGILPSPTEITSAYQAYLEHLASDLDDLAGRLSPNGDTGTIQLAAAIRELYESRTMVSSPVVKTQREQRADWSHNA